MIYDETLDGNLDLDGIKMCVMKRSGERVPFNPEKITNAIHKANREVGIITERLTEDEINKIVLGIVKDVS